MNISCIIDIDIYVNSCEPLPTLEAPVPLLQSGIIFGFRQVIQFVIKVFQIDSHRLGGIKVWSNLILKSAEFGRVMETSFFEG